MAVAHTEWSKMVKVDGTDPKGFGCKGTPL